MNRLSISIVTANRPSHIVEDLQLVAIKCKQLGINIYIFDGSVEYCDIVENKIAEYKRNGVDNIWYKYYSPKNKYMGDKTDIFKRLYDAFDIPETEYIMLSGDKSFLEIEEYERILQLLEKKPDIINLYDKNYKEYYNPAEFIYENMIGLTYYGATVIKKSIVNPLRMITEIPGNGVFLVDNEYARAIDKEDFFGISQNVTYYESIYNTESEGTFKTWEFWMFEWYSLMQNILIRFKSINKDIVSIMDRELGFFSKEELYRQRGMGQFNLQLVWSKRRVIKNVISLSFYKLLLISITNKKHAERVYKASDKYKKTEFLSNEVSRFKVFKKWKRLNDSGFSVSNYFVSRNYKKIAIYGQNDIGIEMKMELDHSKVEVECFIDKASLGWFKGVKSYKPTDNIPNVDVIVVAAINYYDEICDAIKNRITCDIISFIDILNDYVPIIGEAK